MDLQIIRTRHPLDASLGQLTDLLRRLGQGDALEDFGRRLERMPESDRFVLVTVGETLIGYAHLTNDGPSRPQ